MSIPCFLLLKIYVPNENRKTASKIKKSGKGESWFHLVHDVKGGKSSVAICPLGGK